MTSVTVSLTEDLKEEIIEFSWVNWSEIAREEFIKKMIFEKYLKTHEISDEDWEFCDRIDWHPVDELPLKEEFIKELEKAKKEKNIKLRSVSEIFR